jgi:Acyl-protein synthetase, LuxE
MPELQWNHKVFEVEPSGFESLALEIFHQQARNNPIYASYLQALGTDISSIRLMGQIPFLPIRFFKTHEVRSGSFEPETIFESSGTTEMTRSRHFIKDLSIYEESFIKGFRNVYGNPRDYTIFALLPSYTDRPGSSLVYMVKRLIELSGHDNSGFLTVNRETRNQITAQDLPGKKNLLIGVTFALLDLAELGTMELKNTIIMETGGMKGRREEIVRPELHALLKKAFGLSTIHSEYGMTELLSQAYSTGDGIFRCPPWMTIFVRDEEDPLLVKSGNGTLSGVINVIDLANIHSCSFIATDDVGKLYPDGSFEVLGRMDGSDLRGCSLLTL